MNKIFDIFILAWVTARWRPRRRRAPDLIARIHFAGAGQISADTNAAAFTKFGAPPRRRRFATRR